MSDKVREWVAIRSEARTRRRKACRVLVGYVAARDANDLLVAARDANDLLVSARDANDVLFGYIAARDANDLLVAAGDANGY